MSLFEFTFGLSAVILGLALAHMASSVHRLVMAGRRVKWAPEPVLLAGIIFLVIVSVWLGQWGDRDRETTTTGLILLQVTKLLLPFLAAAFVLPETPPEEGPVDLYAHYDRTRAFTFGALIAGLLLFWLDGMVRWAIGDFPEAGPITVWGVLKAAPWEFTTLYALLIFVRRRWVNIVLLTAGLAYYAWQIVPTTLAV
ncbi:hypothetical protein [Brevundimonas sp. UBA2416]|uniref:hypothetical protein n=1 Tax=Brevundimonas sp. UBA2416 TaxID=1946124 RepID=UPI0025C0B85A|nr:hypothetical protein [Brevundimonas sp. UBA2416]